MHPDVFLLYYIPAHLMYHYDVDVSHRLKMRVKSLIPQCELQAQLSMELQHIKCIRFQSDIWSLSSPLSLAFSLPLSVSHILHLHKQFHLKSSAAAVSFLHFPTSPLYSHTLPPRSSRSLCGVHRSRWVNHRDAECEITRRWGILTLADASPKAEWKGGANRHQHRCSHDAPW